MENLDDILKNERIGLQLQSISRLKNFKGKLKFDMISNVLNCIIFYSA